MRFAFVKTTKSIRAQRLHYSHVNITIVVLHELFAINLDEPGESIEIVIEQLQAQLRRKISLRVVQKRRDVILQRAFAATLVIQEKGLIALPHDIA